MKDLLWFLRASWLYLGCDRGTGRWVARREYVTGIWRASRRFRACIRRDQAAGWSR